MLKHGDDKLNYAAGSGDGPIPLEVRRAGKGKKTRTKAKVMATGGWMHGCMDIREEKAKESTE